MPNSSDVRARMGGVEIRKITYTAEEIAERVEQMGRDITAHYPAGESLLCLGLLKGSFIFMADIVRHIARPLHVDFLVASSYGNSTVTSGDVRLLYDPEAD